MQTSSPARSRPPGTVATGARPRWPAAGAGLAATAAALGSAELLGAVVGPAPSLVLAVGNQVIDSVPGWLERAATSTLGTADKPVLVAGVLVVVALLGAAVGLLASRVFRLGAAGVLLAGGLAGTAAAGDPPTSTGWAIGSALVAVAVGVGVLHWLLGRAAGVTVDRTAAGGYDRRGFLVAAGGVGALAVLGGVVGWLMSGRERVEAARARVRLSAPAVPAAAAPAGSALDVSGITPLYTANDAFYRIDTALRVPDVDPAGWRLQVGGMVDRPFSLSYDDLMALPQIEADVTLSCVSNEVGGELVGTARWQGVPLRTLLERAGVQDGGVQLVARSVDDFTAGFPTQHALDVGAAMVAVGMNGEPLPVDHGFPARLVVPGLYGYVSATKWLASIELTGWDVQGYWIPRGWSQRGPIKTQSRIDVPRQGRSVSAGRQAVAGVAWAPTRGISGVEVRVDDGPWKPATLADSIGDDCWRQWSYAWDATPGEHTITARATDGTGAVQDQLRTDVAPDGATGYPELEVEVTV